MQQSLMPFRLGIVNVHRKGTNSMYYLFFFFFDQDNHTFFQYFILI